MMIDYKDKDPEIELRRLKMVGKDQDTGEFEEGLQALVVEETFSEEEQKKEAGLIIENAKRNATDILNEAKQEAIKIKEEAFRQASKQGYEEGIKKANQDAERIKQELREQKVRQEKEYQMLLSQMEGKVAELVASLVAKITGVLAEDKKDIILYLVEKGLRAYDNLETYTIRVSSYDYDLLLSRKEYLEEIVGGDIQITVDSKLDKNQCLIETESKVIDCSLDVQLNNLISDIKLLASV